MKGRRKKIIPFGVVAGCKEGGLGEGKPGERNTGREPVRSVASQRRLSRRSSKRAWRRQLERLWWSGCWGWVEVECEELLKFDVMTNGAENGIELRPTHGAADAPAAEIRGSSPSAAAATYGGRR